MAPIDFFDKILNYYRKDANKDKPVIPRAAAALLSVGFTLTYVIPFYLSAKTRPSPHLSRDAPNVIRARIRAVSIACIITTLVTVFVAVDRAHTNLGQTLQLLGWWPVDPFDVAKSLGLVLLLFIGPLYEAAVVDGQWRHWLSGQGVTETYSTAIGWRNFVAGPITEELVFRSLILPLHLLSLPPSSLHPQDPDPHSIHSSPTHLTIHPAVSQLIFVTPLYFGLAHLHHFYEWRVTHSYAPLIQGISRSVLQFGYTTVFGWLAAFVFLRTGSLVACVVIHAFCNWQGLPRFWGRLGPSIAEPLISASDATPDEPQKDDVRGKEDDEAASTQAIQRRGTMSKERRVKRLGIAWTISYYVLLVVGAVGFYWYLWPLTESKHALVSFGTPVPPKGKSQMAKAVEAGARKVKGEGQQRRSFGFWA